MRRFMARLAIVAGFAAALADPAAAAPLEYCEAYARETVTVMAAAGMLGEDRQKVHDRAFYSCLNMDDEPPMPSVLAGSGPITEAAIEQGSTDAEEPAVPVNGPRQAKTRTGAIERGTPEWAAWCRRHFPNSFDEATGTVVPIDTGKRAPCPIG